MDAVIGFLIERWPVVLVVLVVGYITWKVAQFYYKRYVPLEEKTGILERRGEGMNCANHSKKNRYLRKQYMKHRARLFSS